jgi:hypothetical protein
MTGSPADEGRSAERPTEGASLTTRQLGGYVLIAALILALVRLLRGSRARRG